MAHRWNQQFAGAEPYGGGLTAWLAAVPLTREDLRRARAWLIAVAVLALLGGIVSILVPAITSVTIAIFIGWVLLFAGITTGVHAVTNRAALRGLEATLTVIAGLYLLIFPLSGTVTLTFVLAVWFFASGLLSLAAGIQLKAAPERPMMLFGGLLSIVLGVLIAAELPSSAAWAIGLLVGVNLIFWSIRAIGAAQILKQRLNEL
jgi:uncharacterized membrane protein HdeD (DUF308 family)